MLGTGRGDLHEEGQPRHPEARGQGCMGGRPQPQATQPQQPRAQQLVTAERTTVSEEDNGKEEGRERTRGGQRSKSERDKGRQRKT